MVLKSYCLYLYFFFFKSSDSANYVTGFENIAKWTDKNYRMLSSLLDIVLVNFVETQFLKNRQHRFFPPKFREKKSFSINIDHALLKVFKILWKIMDGCIETKKKEIESIEFILISWNFFESTKTKTILLKSDFLF